MLFENAGGRNGLVAAYLNWLGRQEQAEGYLSSLMKSMGHGDTQKTFHIIEEKGWLGRFLAAFLEAYRQRTEAWKGSDEGSTNPDIGLIKEEVSIVHGMIFDLTRKVDEFMATQEERLQAILVAVKNVKQMLADLKNNNPAIEDEITAIEQELAPATEPAPTEPNP